MIPSPIDAEPGGPVEVQIVREVRHLEFMVADVVANPDGSKTLPIILPGGEVHIFTLGAETARTLGGRLLAPGIEIPTAAAVAAPAGGLL